MPDPQDPSTSPPDDRTATSAARPQPAQPPERLDQVVGGPLGPAADPLLPPPERGSPLDPAAAPPGSSAAPDQLDPLSDAGGFDLSSLFDSAQQLVAAQQEAARQAHVGRSGGGKVEIEVSGAGEFRRVTISPDVVDSDDVGLLEDLVLAALHDAMARVNEAQSSALGGFDLGQLGGLLGNG